MPTRLRKIRGRKNGEPDAVGTYAPTAISVMMTKITGRENGRSSVRPSPGANAGQCRLTHQKSLLVPILRRRHRHRLL